MAEPIKKIAVLWITAGLSCDGDTISMIAATQPSLEDILLRAIPGVPEVTFHNPLLAFDVGNDFLRPFYLAAEASLGPFILVIEGSIPDERNKSEGYWAGFGTDENGPAHSYM
jgi:hydrogenase small subunit